MRWFAPLVLLLGCRSPTQVTLALSTDASCADLGETRITIGPLGDVAMRDPVTVTTQCDAGVIGSLVVVPSADDGAEVGFQIVTSLGQQPVTSCDPEPAEHCIVARRALRFVPETPLRVPIVMRQSCAGVVCAPDETCVGGECAPAFIDPSECADADGCGEEALEPEESPDEPIVPGAWTLELAQGEGNRVTDLVVGESGDTYVVGQHIGEGLLGSGQVLAGFVARFDRDGQLRWSERFQSAKESAALTVAIDASENVYVGGFFHDGVLVAGHAFAAAGRQMLLVRLHNDGQFGWLRYFTGSTAPAAVTAATVSGADLFVGGPFRGGLGAGLFEFNAGGDTHVVVAKLSAETGQVHDAIATFGVGTHAVDDLLVTDDKLRALISYTDSFGLSEGVLTSDGGLLAPVLLQLGAADLAGSPIIGNTPAVDATTSLRHTKILSTDGGFCTASEVQGSYQAPDGSGVKNSKAVAGYVACTLTDKGSPAAYEFVGSANVIGAGLADAGGGKMLFGGTRSGPIDKLVAKNANGTSGMFLTLLDVGETALDTVALLDSPGEDTLMAFGIDPSDGGIVLAGTAGGALKFGDGAKLTVGATPSLFLTRLAQLPE